MFAPQVTVFQQEHYLENFVQSTFDALPSESLAGEFQNAHCYSIAEDRSLSSFGNELMCIDVPESNMESMHACVLSSCHHQTCLFFLCMTGSTLVVSGDGRYLTKPSVATIVRMAAANGVGKVESYKPLCSAA